MVQHRNTYGTFPYQKLVEEDYTLFCIHYKIFYTAHSLKTLNGLQWHNKKKNGQQGFSMIDFCVILLELYEHGKK